MNRPALPGARWSRHLVASVGLLMAGTLAACSTTAIGGVAAGSEPLPGIDKTSVRIGYTVVDGGKLAGALGFNRIDTGDAELQARMIQAFVEYANQNGGFGGRRATPIVQNYVSATASADQSQSLCSGFTQDAKVFAAVLDGQYENNVLPCYRSANTLMVDETLVAHDSAQFAEYAPYLWSPTHPEYAGFVQAQLEAMRSEGFFTGASGVQILSVDNDVSRRVANEVVQPFLAAEGITTIRVDYIDSTDNGTLGTTTAAAIAAGTSGGTDRVVTIGGARILPVALADVGASTYLSTWSVSSWDSPNFLETNPDTVVTERIVGTSGLGYIPAYDVAGERGGPFPDPARPAEGLCKVILDAAGIVPGEGQRENYRSAFQYCDATFFLKAALDQVRPGGGLTAAEFKDGVSRIGTGYASSLAFGSAFGPGQYAATNAGRALIYDASCSCFTYKGENVPISGS